MKKIKKIKFIITAYLMQSIATVYLFSILLVINDSLLFISRRTIIIGLIILNLLGGFFSLFSLKNFDDLISKILSYQIVEIKRREQEDYINKLSSQKHDFANHLQTIGALAQLDKTNEIISYLSDINQDLSSIEQEESLNQSTLDTILNKKKKWAKNKGVDFKYNLEEGTKEIDLSLNKLFRLMYNLVDNAVEASLKSSTPKVRVTGTNFNNNYVIAVYNNGATISQNMIEKIQQPGVSSKGSNRGYGVYIIKNIVQNAGGKLNIKSSKEFGTEFKCYL